MPLRSVPKVCFFRSEKVPLFFAYARRGRGGGFGGYTGLGKCDRFHLGEILGKGEGEEGGQKI